MTQSSDCEAARADINRINAQNKSVPHGLRLYCRRAKLQSSRNTSAGRNFEPIVSVLGLDRVPIQVAFVSPQSDQAIEGLGNQDGPVRFIQRIERTHSKNGRRERASEPRRGLLRRRATFFRAARGLDASSLET